jgi:hypothetical protein
VTRFEYPPDCWDVGQCLVPRCPRTSVNFESVCAKHWQDKKGEYAALMVLGHCIVDQCETQRIWPDGFCDDHWSQACAEAWRIEYREPLRRATTTPEGVDLGPVFQLLAEGVPLEWAMSHGESQAEV